jgi:hypothetical protein
MVARNAGTDADVVRASPKGLLMRGILHRSAHYLLTLLALIGALGLARQQFGLSALGALLVGAFVACLSLIKRQDAAVKARQP